MPRDSFADELAEKMRELDRDWQEVDQDTARRAAERVLSGEGEEQSDGRRQTI